MIGLLRKPASRAQAKGRHPVPSEGIGPDSGKTLTLGKMIALGAKRFQAARIRFGQGTLRAHDEARWLALAALHLPVDSPLAIEKRELTPSQAARVQAMFDRRISERLPAAYITGTAWLKGYAFKVDPRVIIPRSFIAELILGQFHPWITKPASVKRILDLCTGSGCLAIIAADCFPKAEVLATDLSSDALRVAASNVRRYQLMDRVTLAQGNLFEAIARRSPKSRLEKESGGRADQRSGSTTYLKGIKTAQAKPFDLIICNPPYVPRAKRKSLPAEFLHEPEMAFMAEDKGMSLVRELIGQAGHHLSADGILVVEIGHERRACDAMLAKDFPGLVPIWVETAEQSDNVFLLHASQLQAFTRRPYR